MKPRSPIVLDKYPKSLKYFQPDVQEIYEVTLERYGPEEWNAIVLTSELHGHLGIYSIMGAKMGIYAREILKASVDELRVISYAGSDPPISCFNDGLQVSTGATLGQGMISIAEDKHACEAAFMIGDRGIRLGLVPEIFVQAGNDIVRTLEKYNDMNEEYFADIRKLALDYWRDMDRQKIFMIMD